VTDQVRRPLDPKDIGLFNEATNGAGSPPGDRFEQIVRDLLRQHWLDEEPGEGCFDAAPARMEGLLSFHQAKASPEDSASVRAHLVNCARCRFIYACMREQSAAGPVPTPAPRDAADQVSGIIRDRLRSTGPVIFPGGELAYETWEFGLLNELPAETAEQISEAVADRGWRKLRGMLPRKEIVLVCFSQPVHRFGKRLAAKIVQTGAKDVHVVMADDFFSPKLWCDPRELRGRHVVVFVDVVHSGGLLKRLYSVCREANPRSLSGVAVIDQSWGSVADEPFCALWTEPPEGRIRLADEPPADARFFDPVAARARAREDLPHEVADPSRARITIESHLREIGPLFAFIEQTGALKRDAVIGDVCYPWTVDLICLLGHEEARKELIRRAVDRLADLGEQGPWCLVYPAERYKRAGAWAALLAEALGWPVVKIGLKDRTHYRRLTYAQRRALARCSRALVVDAAVRTGKTLQSLVGMLRGGANPSARNIVAFYAFDGLFEEPRKELERELYVEIRSLFRLPLGMPTEPVGRHCRERISETLAELEETDSTERQDKWIGVVRAYCRKKLATAGRPPKPDVKATNAGRVEQSLRRAFDEGERGTQARLEHACDPPQPSLVKHLDVEYALQEPRTRNVLHGFLCNSMPAEFIEWCALALATQQDYDWLDRDWLVLHKRFFTNADSDRWQFLACVGYWIRRQGRPEVVGRIRTAVAEFCRCEAKPFVASLFPELPADGEDADPLQARCQTLLSVLS
jgi:hypothetical protein